MKKVLTTLMTLFVLSMSIFTLNACGGVEFKVNFVVDGAVYATINTNGQEIIKMPENPTKEGYTFDGWYWDKDTWQTPFTANSLLDAPLSSDMNVYAKWKANVVNVENISLNKTEITLHENDVEYLTATVLPANATDTSVVWESSNSTIATVVGGKVTALRVGNATISAITNDGGKIATCNVYVEPILVESVNLNYTSLSLLNGESKTLTATVLPNNATEKGVNWSSSNPSIVTVENGAITAVGYGSATITVSTIDGNKTATCVVEVIEDKITFNTLSVEDETVYGKVSNSTTTFSFIKEITEHGNATYKVYKEITCETEINSKSISLNVGDNTVYILQTVGRDLKLYTVTVRRRPMYEVTFNVDGGTAVSSQIIEEDSFATEPTTSRIGYTFNGWDFDFNTPITQSITIKANWSANTNTPYKVEYYLENLEDENYTLTETANKTGTTDTIANAEIKTFAHFTHKSSSTDSGNIAPNGSTILKVYYTRDKYSVTFDGNGGTLTSGKLSQTVKYGGSVAVPTFTKTGYSLAGFDKKLTNVSESFTATAMWNIIVYTITYDLDGGCTSNPTSYTIETDTITLNNPRKTNHGFLGWYNGNKKIETIEPSTQKDYHITAKWEYALIIGGSTLQGVRTSAKTTCYEIEVPNSVTTINSGVFNGCIVLEKITLPFVGAKAGAKDGDTYQYPFGYIFGTSSYTGSYSATQYYYGSSTSSTTSSTYYIPSSLKSVTITGGNILYGAFYYCNKLTSIEIPASVTSIGERAFYYCNKLTSIEIPASVTSIGEGAFYNCMAIEEINFNATNCANLSSVNYVFAYAGQNGNGIKVTFGNSVTHIPANLFYCYSSSISRSPKLTSVTIGNSVTSIGSGAFYGCSSLTSIEIPNSMTSIGSGAFYGCSSLQYNVEGNLKYLGNSTNPYLYLADTTSDSITSATINSKCKIIGYDAFFACDSLTSVVIPNSVTSIGEEAFYNCDSLTSVVIPNSVTSIGNHAFDNCDLLTSVVIPNSVTNIGYMAFRNCSSLTSIVIPNGVTSIGGYAFYDCSSLQYNVEGNLKYLGNTTNPYLYLADTTSTSINSATVNSKCKFIGACAFFACDSLTSIEIPASVTSIGYEAFEDCYSLTSIEIPASVTSIGNLAFKDCDSLTSVVIPNSVTSIGDCAFDNCDSLTSVVIPNSVTSIGTWAFKNCTSLEAIEIPNSVTSIDTSTFENCTSLESVVIPNSVTSIGDDAFRNCSSLKSVVIPNSVTSIGSGAFYGCSSLTSIEIPNSVTSIGSWAFYDCSSLTSIKYRGTKSQWQTISKGTKWSYNTGNYTITYNYTGN